jgi:hypothetical protein
MTEQPVDRVTEEDWKQIRETADKLQGLLSEAKVRRQIAAAAIGVALGEQYPTNAGLAAAVRDIASWAMIARTHGEPVS